MRVLGVDYGRSRTGLALSDPLGVTCDPLRVLREPNRDRLILRIVDVVEEHEVGEIVVGLPRPLSGGTNQQMEDVLSFVASLDSEAPVPVHVWDERFTSKLAEEGRRGDRDRDAVAACYMLQNYLDARTTGLGGS